MKQTLILFFLTTSVAMASNNRQIKHDCLLPVAGLIERAFPSDGYQLWHPVSADILVTGNTHLGAMAKLKKVCLDLGNPHPMRLVGSDAPAIHFSNQAALIERAVSICEPLIKESATCEVSQ